MPSGFDDVVKPAFRKWFLGRGVHVETEVEVLAHTRTIDLVVDMGHQKPELLDGACFDFITMVGVVDLKGPGDPLTDNNFSRGMSRGWGLEIMERLAVDASRRDGSHPDIPGKKEHGVRPKVLRPIARSVTFICFIRPRAILSGETGGYGFEPTEEPGVYICREMLEVRILVPNEMELTERNYPVMALARGAKLREFVRLCVRDGRTELLEMSLELCSATGTLATVWPEVMEVAEMKSGYTPEVLEVIEKGIQRLPDLPTNKRMRELEERERHAAATARQAEVIACQAEVDATQAKDNAVRFVQGALLRLAGRKFAPVPENITRRIEQTRDMGQLNIWLEQMVDANVLSETELGRGA